jgi:hypothetical protein
MTIPVPFRALLVFAVCLGGVSAHDGGFGHSRRTIFADAAADGFILEYRIIQNRDEALTELTIMDTDRDGKISAEEKENYFSTRGRQIAKLLDVRTMKGQPVALKFVDHELHQALVQSYRFKIESSANEILLDDRVFPHKPGLVQVRHGSGVKLEQARPTNLAHAERVSLRITRVTP